MEGLGPLHSHPVQPRLLPRHGPSPAPPDGPTFTEAGLAAAPSTNWFSVSTPAAMLPAIAAALGSDAVKARFEGIGVRPGTLGTEGYTALIRDELSRRREVIRTGNIRAD